VQRELGLSEKQCAELQDISNRYWKERRRIAGDELDDMELSVREELGAISEKARHGIVQSSHIGTGPTFSRAVVGQLERQWNDARGEVENVLAPEQLKSLKDLTFRTFAFGAGVLRENDVAAKLELSQDQQTQLESLEVELQKEKKQRLCNVTREKLKKMLALLTPEQRNRIAELGSNVMDSNVDCSNYPFPQLPSHMPDTGIAEALGFTSEQREDIRKIVKTHWSQLGRLDGEEQSLSQGNDAGFQAIKEKRRLEMEDLRKRIEAALTPEQWASCQEMAKENSIMPYLRRAMINPQDMAAVDMELSDKLCADLRQIDSEYNEQAEQVYRELTDRAIAVLTPEQQEKLRAEVDRRGW
jgi:hypothetical protein